MSGLFFSELKICILQLLKVFAVSFKVWGVFLVCFIFLIFANLTIKSRSGSCDVFFWVSFVQQLFDDFTKNVSTMAFFQKA